MSGYPKYRPRKMEKEYRTGRKRKGAALSDYRCLCPHPEEEAELLREIARFRAEHHRVPSFLEAFRLLQGLGWRRNDQNKD